MPQGDFQSGIRKIQDGFCNHCQVETLCQPAVTSVEAMTSIASTNTWHYYARCLKKVTRTAEWENISCVLDLEYINKECHFLNTF